ncbi:unnamed protein product [Gadus morhua 'NCC']
MGEVVTEEEEEEELGDPMSPLLKSGQCEQGRPGQACHCDGLPFWTTAQCYDALDKAPRGQGSVVEGKAKATSFAPALSFMSPGASSPWLPGFSSPLWDIKHPSPIYPPSPTLASRPHVHTLSPSEAHGAFAHSALKYRPS